MTLTPAHRALIALVSATALTSLPAMAQAPKPKPFDATCAKVVAVNDGDTFRCVRSGGKWFPVRVVAIDAPETSVQRSDELARARLVALAVNGSAAKCSGKRNGKRWVCQVYTPQGQDVGALLIEAGAAWFFRYYATELSTEDAARYGQLESQARSARTGLWADADAMAPWECRQNMELGKPCR